MKGYSRMNYMRIWHIKKISIILAVSLSMHIAVAADSSPPQNFPASLPSVPEQSPLTELNTPKYVIIRSSDQATFSSETAAGVANIYVKEGSQFKAGDILLTLDCRLQQAELNKALAQQTAAKMAQQSAKKLQSYGSISTFELVKADSEEKVAEADVDKLRAIVEKCVIKAPFNGAVAEVMVHAHESVKPGDPLLKIVGMENLEFEMQVPSCWLAWVHAGTNFNVHINETNKTISAKISKINPQIESVSQTVKLIATVPPDPSLLPGMSGQAIFPDDPEKICPQGKK